MRRGGDADSSDDEVSQSYAALSAARSFPSHNSPTGGRADDTDAKLEKRALKRGPREPESSLHAGAYAIRPPILVRLRADDNFVHVQ